VQLTALEFFFQPTFVPSPRSSRAKQLRQVHGFVLQRCLHVGNAPLCQPSASYSLGWHMKKRTSYNPKRRIADPDAWPFDRRKASADGLRYTGSPVHKSKPADFGLDPPTSPRPGKTLCDKVREFSRAQAQELLRTGLGRAMVSVQEWGGWPQNVWSVLDGEAFEAQLENREQGTYHGYPMAADDDFRRLVLREWDRRGR
jgi:hypothetical protein